MFGVETAEAAARANLHGRVGELCRHAAAQVGGGRLVLAMVDAHLAATLAELGEPCHQRIQRTLLPAAFIQRL